MQNNKLCLISLESKRSLEFGAVTSFCAKLASFGYYFDKVCKVAYDDSDEIVSALGGAKDRYENLFVLCPSGMVAVVKQYLSEIYGGEFDAIGIMTVQSSTVFVLQSDGGARMCDEDIKLRLDDKYGIKYARTYVRVCATAEAVSRAVGKARELLASANQNVYINVKEDYGDFRIELVYSSLTSKIYLDEAVRTIVGDLSGYVYAMEDVSLAEQLFRLLKLRRMRISFAESFTGGGVGKKLIEVSGASEVYFEGLNTYSNESKTSRLGVGELTLKQHGAVSAETAYEMAEGLLKTGNCEVSVSTTGIAGPKSDNTQKPVGLAYIGVGVMGEIFVYKFNFTGNREEITKTAINQALFLAYKSLK